MPTITIIGPGAIGGTVAAWLAQDSIHADRLAGRPTEIGVRNGAVVRIGERHGIDTPMNRLTVTLIKAAGIPGPAMPVS